MVKLLKGGIRMVYKKLQKLLAMTLTAAMVATGFPSLELHANAAQIDKSGASSVEMAENTTVKLGDEGVYHVTVDDTGYINADASYDPEGTYAADVNTPFAWDNVNMYFVITDRFYNGDTSNDHSYGRSATSSTVSTIKDTANKESAADTFKAVAGSYASSGDGSARNYKSGSASDGYLSNSSKGTFHGGDLKGLTENIKNGYFDALGTNAIWLTAPYEQVHGAICSSGFKHYPYHGYYALDYTEVDANMGTAEDLHEFIDTAHEHGIRVVFDVVMNHSGYPDGYTIAEYYGADSPLLNSGWQKTYFGMDESSLSFEYDYSSLKGENGILKYGDTWNSSWFTTAWQRMVQGRYGSGYTEQEGASLTACSGGLPDFKTESGSQLGIPDILSKKWSKEGRLSEKTKETQAMLSACGYGSTATVKQYLVAWLANWVREYGVDGYRCDTAKHVGIDCWADLKSQCVKALNEWRKNNSDKECSKWTDDFWMTGEVFDQGLSMNYGGTDYTQGFDSLINFTFKEKEESSVSDLDAIFSEYATYARSSEKGDPLSYISSHDKGIGKRSAKAGTSLLLLPGGVQTYYGDETGREGGREEQSWRTNMNWSSMNKEILSNWQKIGRFRRGHISVGAGTHKKLADSPYTFSRTYKGKATIGATKETAYEDSVVVSLPEKAGTYDITVGSAFTDGTEVTDEYSGETYTVSGGKVSGVKCDSNGVILLGIPAETTPKAKVSATVTDGTMEDGVYTSDEITVTLKTDSVSDAAYAINDGEKVKFDGTATVTFGADTAYDEETTIKVTGTSTLDKSEVSKTFTYKRSSEPTIGVSATGLYIRVNKADFDKAPQIYVYSADAAQTTISAAWPGDEMKLDGDYYVYSNDKITSQVRAIIHSPAWRSVPDMKDPDPVEGAVELDKSTSTFKKIQIASETDETGKVTLKFVDDSDKELKTIYRSGKVGDSYSFKVPTSLSKPSGYDVNSGQDTVVKGTFEAKETTVTIKYHKSTEAEATATPAATATPTATPTAKPTATPTEKPTAEPTATPKPISVELTKTSPKGTHYAGEKITLTASATCASGTCKYQFVIEDQHGVDAGSRKYSVKNTHSWTPASAGVYSVTIFAKDAETLDIDTINEQIVVVKAPKLKVKSFSVKRTKKLTYKITGAAKAGTKRSYQYKFATQFNGKTTVQKNYSSTKTKTLKFKKAGTYTFIMYIKDSSGNVVKKTKKVKVK